MNARRSLATSRRVLTQLRHDPRTIALIVVVPSLLLVIMRYVFDGQTAKFDAFAPMLLAIFPFVLMFIVTSIATLRERTSGTLERLLTTPLTTLDFMAGYALAFSVLAIIQGVVATLVVHWLGVTVAGGSARLLLVGLLAGLLGEALGLFVSLFARSEFQAVQFMPALVLPQLLVCGLFVPRDQMAVVLQWLANIMPLTYLVDAAKLVSTEASWTGGLTRDLGVVGGYIVAALVAGAVSLRD